MSGRTLADLRDDTKLRYAIERAFMCIDAAIKDIPTAMVARHDLPMQMIAGFRNRLAHTYEDVIDKRILTTVGEDLPALDLLLAAIIADLEADA